MEEPEINYYRSVGFFPRVTKFNLPKKRGKFVTFLYLRYSDFVV